MSTRDLEAENARLRSALTETVELAKRLDGMAHSGAGFVEHWGERVLQAVRPAQEALWELALAPSPKPPEAAREEAEVQAVRNVMLRAAVYLPLSLGALESELVAAVRAALSNGGGK